MRWFDTVKSPKLKSAKRIISNTPTGLWKKCTHCSEIIQASKLVENFNVCPYCEHHFRLMGRERLDLLLDQETFTPFGENLATKDPLVFTDKKPYKERLVLAKEKTGNLDSVFCGLGEIEGQKVSIAAMDFQFMGGSMGVVTGEKIALTFDNAVQNKVPAIIVSCSGGARMQEGILSLMQMAKTSASRQKLKAAGIPFISILTDPTTGGVAASFAMLGDINIAEPRALIGFAGPRVIEQSIRQILPDGFQRSEFLLEHGFIDSIIPRYKLKAEVSFFLKMFSGNI
jgi:acetyl-CoA carboxylase carboxyl transferase subunit beta